MHARTALLLVTAALAVDAVGAQSPAAPTARLLSASRLNLPGEIDSSNPAVWDLVDGVARLFVISSWGGIPVRSSGAGLDALQHGEPVQFITHPGHGVWMESILQDDQGVWFGYYHHERPADACGRPDRQLPRLGAARSDDQGRTWTDLGIVLDAPPGTDACGSANRFVLGGVGDVSVMLDADAQNAYLFFSQYSLDPAGQGVGVARLAWADRDAPAGKVTIWHDGAWLPVSGDADAGWIFPAGTPLVRATQPFHDRSAANNVFWGASVHWNTYLEQYVMLLNRARDEVFGQEGIYVSYAPSLDDPRRWTPPVKILNGGTWYPQVIGLETGSGTDRLAGKRARFFMMGRSERMIEFEQ